MQVAITSNGKLYCSLTQVNTTSKVFCAFISKLAAKLSEEDRDWKSNSILLIDGAKYQTSKESIDHLKALAFVCVFLHPILSPALLLSTSLASSKP